MRLPKWLLIEPDPPPQDPSVAAAKREQLVQNIVRRYLERDDVYAGISDWLTNVYEDGDPPVRDLFDRIAIQREIDWSGSGDTGEAGDRER